MSTGSTPTRRNVLAGSSAGLLLPQALRAATAGPSRFSSIVGAPDAVYVFTENERLPMTRAGSKWQAKTIEVRLESQVQHSAVFLTSPSEAVLRVRLRWGLSIPAGLLFMGDQWERSYGDLAWRSMEPERIMPWYFLATGKGFTHGCGVKTASAALCFWQVDPSGVSLWLDVRNGGQGVRLGRRELAVAEIVVASYSALPPFRAATNFCRALCDKPRLPAAPVYGGNNWYYAYGKSSAADIRADSERMASVAPNARNRPFMVIDDGWQPHRTAGPWSANAQFGDMARLAEEMRKIGVRPGLWMRPLFTKEQLPPGWGLNSPNAAREFSAGHSLTLDPTVPEALAKVERDLKTVSGWGYELIKHDFSTYDLLGDWGFAMGAEITASGWGFHDETRTNAEIIRGFYAALREAAGNAMLLGCNTIGHLSAGLFEVQRTGDDTSGRDWNRTRKMGVNTLAFRAPQHNNFFAVDADCVGLTREIAWELNRQWLDLLAHSGTPLFVSAAPDAFGTEQQRALRDAFRLAAEPQPLAEPLDWLDNNEPQRWSFKGRAVSYDWFERAGSSPFLD